MDYTTNFLVTPNFVIERKEEPIRRENDDQQKKLAELLLERERAMFIR